MYITQGSNGRYSHRGTCANDVRGKEPGVRYPYYAPCDVRCVKVYTPGQSMWQSNRQVRFANGRIDYATFMLAHDETSNHYPGEVVSQGDTLGYMGMAGNATGVHCHIEIEQGKDTTWKKNAYGIYCFNNEYDPDFCYFVNDTNILNGMGGDWKMTEDIPVKEFQFRAHVADKGWLPWVKEGEIAGTTGEARRLEAIQIDCSQDVEAKAHIQDVGWVEYGKINKDTVIGTVGEAKRLECLCLKGNFKYRVHLQDTGWTCWTNADGICTLGSVGQGLQMEAIQIKEIL